MLINTNLEPLKINYPKKEEWPQNLLKTQLHSKFVSSSGLKPFQEQFMNEKKPHSINSLHYQNGEVEGREAIKFYWHKKPYKIIYADEGDKFIKPLLSFYNKKRDAQHMTWDIPTTLPSHIARTMRELALKWVAQKFFQKLNFTSYDEPIVSGVNPDLLVVPKEELGKFSSDYLTSKIKENPSPLNPEYKAPLAEIELTNGCFVEIKAYHKITDITEKEVLQSYEYANLGCKTLLLTTGTINNFDAIEILNSNKEKHMKVQEGYDKMIWDQFVNTVKSNSRKKVKNLKLGRGMDQFDTRGIYLSAPQKLKKVYKYTKNWPPQIHYTLLDTPQEILDFINTPQKAEDVILGIIQPSAFHKLLRSSSINLQKAARLFKNIQKSYIEHIMIDPTNLYPGII